MTAVPPVPSTEQRENDTAFGLRMAGKLYRECGVTQAERDRVAAAFSNRQPGSEIREQAAGVAERDGRSRPQTRIRDATPLHVTYTNHRGETSVRKIIPLGPPVLESTEWHPEPQWLLRAFDVGKQAERLFALQDFAPPKRASAEPDAWPDVLPCSVRLPPSTVIRKGCRISTLMEALKLRVGMDLEFSAPLASPDAIAVVERMRDEWRQSVLSSYQYFAHAANEILAALRTFPAQSNTKSGAL